MQDYLRAMGVYSFARRNIDLLACILSGLIVSIWTLLRFFTQQSTYDLVTQQAVAINWASGNFGNVIFGPTHYLLKTLILYIPVELLPGSPRLKLILLTILINVVTVSLMFVLLKKILPELGVANSKYLSAVVLWLATIAGSVFWIQYANSRNLEVVGGLLLIYLGLKFLKKPTNKLTASLIIVSSLLFFSDKLQIYMTAMPLLVYSVIIYRKKLLKSNVPALAGLVFGSVLVSLLLLKLSMRILNIQFTTSDSLLVHCSWSDLPHSLANSANSLLVLFSGDSEATTGRMRQIFNLAFLAVTVLLFIWAAVKKILPSKLIIFIAAYFICNELIYLVSGQAMAGDTSRYLVMLAPVTLLGIAGVLNLVKTNQSFINGFMLLLAFNFLSLVLVLGQNLNTSFPKDAHLGSIASYASQHDIKTVYGSMNSILPLMYYRTAPNELKFVALACSQPKLVLAHSVPNPDESVSYKGQSALIIDGNAISNFPNVCTKDMIISQLGMPIATDKTNDGSDVLIYKNSVFNSLD